MRDIEAGYQLPGPYEERPTPPSPPIVIVHPRPNSDDSQNVSDDEGASPARSVRQARRASPESCSPLSTVSKSAPLASSESLSSLSSVSTQSSRATKQSLNEVPPTSAHTPFDFLEGTRALPFNSLLHAEAHGHPDTEDLDDTSTSGVSHDQRPRERQDSDFPRSLGDILEDDPIDLAEYIQPKRSACNIEEGPKSDEGESSDLSREFLGPEQDSSSDDDSLPDDATFMEKILHPSYIPTIDKCCRIIFPLTFLVFNIFYWLFHFM
ncbi:gamma-aminobutyric acid receptor subunit theta-like [Sorex araneus]|uniref:gamma-aminobutyric acid receptor subunit theta-like n=1 Tax=Sorex araneus TaxID=42254 RepID=UPI0024339582|nr:gamma-aminobutyric acid receptor subunit theta-like [Sorex araneus]